MQIVGAILSYNVPEVTDRLFLNLRAVSCSYWPIIVLDNGSDPGRVSQYTTDHIQQNCRMTGGFNRALQLVRERFDADAVWLFTNDCFFTRRVCPLANMTAWMQQYPEIGILHPALHPDVQVCYDIKHSGAESGLRVTNMFDFVCPLFTRKALDAINWQFDSRLYYGWGLDFESSYLVRRAGLRVAINYDLIVNHETSTTYDRSCDAECRTRRHFYSRARREMRTVFTDKYGSNWQSQFLHEHTEDCGAWMPFKLPARIGCASLSSATTSPS